MLRFISFFVCQIRIHIIIKNWLKNIYLVGVRRFLWILIVYRPISTWCWVTRIFQIDNLRFILIILRLWIRGIIILCRSKLEIFNNNKTEFVWVLMLLLRVLILTFITSNLLIFYILFEVSLIPTLILIIGWGYQPERIQAGIYIIMYTICASLPLLLVLIFTYKENGTLFMSLREYKFSIINLNLIRIWWAIFIIAFIVKIPMYITHLWLPKAHVEAPVSGSIVLAGVLLKLGGYGLLRIRRVFKIDNRILCLLFVSISLWGAVVTRLICLRQVDLKSLIAYSSVGHMGLIIGGIIGNQLWGWSGRLTLILAHGLVSSGLFRVANILYENTSTRSLYLRKGLIRVMPGLRMFWFILSVINIGAPPSINLLGEILLLTRILNISNWISVLLGLRRFLAGGYSLYLYTSTQHGSLSRHLHRAIRGDIRSYTSLFLHISPAFLLITIRDFIRIWC